MLRSFWIKLKTLRVLQILKQLSATPKTHFSFLASSAPKISINVTPGNFSSREKVASKWIDQKKKSPTNPKKNHKMTVFSRKINKLVPRPKKIGPNPNCSPNSPLGSFEISNEKNPSFVHNLSPKLTELKSTSEMSLWKWGCSKQTPNFFTALFFTNPTLL